MLQSFQSRKEIAKRHPYFYIDQKRKDQIIMIVISFICEEFFFSCRVEIAPHFGPLETWTLQSTSSSSLLVFGHFFIVRKIHNDIPFLHFLRYICHSTKCACSTISLLGGRKALYNFYKRETTLGL